MGRQVQQAGDRGDLVEIALQWALFGPERRASLSQIVPACWGLWSFFLMVGLPTCRCSGCVVQGVRPIARWRRSRTPEQARHQSDTQQERRSGAAALFDYQREHRQLTVWPDGTLEAREGGQTKQLSLVGAEAISVGYGGDVLPTIHFGRVLFAQETAVMVRDRLGKTTQVSIRWAISLEAKQQLEEVVAGFVGKVDVSLASAGAHLLAVTTAEPTADQPPRDPTRELRRHAAVLQERLAADPDDGAALAAARRNPKDQAALQALTTAVHHRAELEPGFEQELAPWSMQPIRACLPGGWISPPGQGSGWPPRPREPSAGF